MRFLHFGRFDPSKNIREILSTCQELRENGFDIHFKQIGSASNLGYDQIAKKLQAEFHSQQWASFFPSVSRAKIPLEVEEASVFIHAYRGSLDKTLVEATLQELPVVSVNPEYIKIFGSWTNESSPSLFDECKAFLNADINCVKEEISRRREIALKHHTLNNWADEISKMYT
jgi:glycosyltransferase involved in cell wall biosynthesis